MENIKELENETRKISESESENYIYDEELNNKTQSKKQVGQILRKIRPFFNWFGRFLLGVFLERALYTRGMSQEEYEKIRAENFYRVS